MKWIKSYIKKLLPNYIWSVMHDFRYHASFFVSHINANRACRKLRKKQEPLNVLFFALYESVWKYDSVFQHMLKDPNFNPLIIVCPVVNNGQEYMLQTIKRCYDYFESKGYPCICAYDEKTDTYIDPHQYKPDIIFYTRPYPSEINSMYVSSNFKDVLSCYVNYFYITMKNSYASLVDFHKLVWRYYLEYPEFLEQITKNSLWFKYNGRVVGYPLFDSFRMYNQKDSDWPIVGKRKKRIIWAPHHTIGVKNPMVALSTFERYYELMLKIAENYKDTIEIVFKPHPLLKPNLYNAQGWGKQRTDAYYEKWANSENTALIEGEYIGLFFASDAMIHDCNSFTVEYLAVHKPAMFLNSGKADDTLNHVAIEARRCYYNGSSEKDIERFVQQVVLGDEDELKDRREAFFKKYILPTNGKLAAENIIDDLLTSLGRK